VNIVGGEMQGREDLLVGGGGRGKSADNVLHKLGYGVD